MRAKRSYILTQTKIYTCNNHQVVKLRLLDTYVVMKRHQLPSFASRVQKDPNSFGQKPASNQYSYSNDHIALLMLFIIAFYLQNYLLF